MSLKTPTTSKIVHAVRRTVAHYDNKAADFWEGTKDHDVSQNISALLRHMACEAPGTILDFGCGPGRDLKTLKSLGHAPVGLEGAASFIPMAQAHSNCPVWHQDFLQLDLPDHHFDGIFANAVLFHIPYEELPRVLQELRQSLKPGGVLFASNPHGPDVENDVPEERYGCYLSWDTWKKTMEACGYQYLEHYYRPAGKPRSEQPWLASVWRTKGETVA